MQNKKTQEYSKALNLGKQTTTSTRWFQFGNDGAIVDSPGFQEFGLAHLTLNDIMRGFPKLKRELSTVDLQIAGTSKNPNVLLKQP